MLSLLRQALEQDTLKVQYQPTIELATGRIVGVEAQYAQRDDLECEYGQGYLWSPPVDAEAIGDLLATQANGS